MNPAIVLRGVTRTFGAVQALQDVDLTVPEHSILGLLGRNGAGKTTLMSVVSGQDRPTTGEVSVLGHTPFEHAPTLQQISYVRDNQRYPDDYRLHHVLRIAPAFAPRWNEDLARELVEGLRIPARTPLKKLSRGQLSAVAIVLGLASRAPVTLLDEPYLGLDVAARAYFHEILIRDYTEVPRTIVLSTHLVEESAGLFDRVAIVDQGRIVVDDETESALDRAVTISGQADAVDTLLAEADELSVLDRRSVGALASATATGGDDRLRERAAHLGVQVQQASLQQLVSAIGANEPTPTTTMRSAA